MKRSKFSLSHYHLTTGHPGNLYPITWFEALPGDSIQQATSALVRFTPLVAPVMHPMQVRIHHFFVPNRLIWDDFEDFITGGNQGTATPVHPYSTLSSLSSGHSLYSYLGIPQGTFTGELEFSALPKRAYALIWNEFYRDQDIQSKIPVIKTSGLDQSTSELIMRVSWEKDYFTTCRPWESKGNEVNLPIGTSAPIVPFSENPMPSFQNSGASGNTLTSMASGAGVELASPPGVKEGLEWDQPNLFADLSAATGVTINDFRLALAIQRYQEARAQYGSRYVEYLRYLGVRSSDARLQNPEYLGGGKQVVQFSEVLQTQSTDSGTTPLGTLGGHGIGAVRTNRYRRYFEEHGIVMSLMSVIPKAIYANAVDRAYLRTVKEDYFQKELQYLGDQEVTNREAMADHTQPDTTFGYQQRYDEYRQKNSFISGAMSNAIEYWHLARMYDSDIALNDDWLKANPSNRIYADTTQHPMQFMISHSIQARRPMAANPKPRTF